MWLKSPFIKKVIPGDMPISKPEKGTTGYPARPLGVTPVGQSTPGFSKVAVAVLPTVSFQT
jgi:hypothetical protein